MTVVLLHILTEAAEAACSGASCLKVGIGTSLSIWQILTRIITYLAGTIGAVSSAMFLVGALMIVLSGAKEDLKEKGKNMMIGSILAAGVVLGAYAILRTVKYFLG